MNEDKKEEFSKNQNLYELFNINCDSTMNDLKLSYKKVN